MTGAMWHRPLGDVALRHTVTGLMREAAIRTLWQPAVGLPPNQRQHWPWRAGSGCVPSHRAVRGCNSAIGDQPSPGVSTWIISGVSEITSGIQAMAALK